MKKVLIFMASVLLVAGTLYAGSGDLIVNGNLGVGTTSPSYKLQVDTGAQGYLGIEYDTNGYGGLAFTENGIPSGYIQLNDTDAIDKLEFLVGGGSGADRKMVIQDDGNVGIGTTSPGAKLHVAGGDVKLDNNQGLFFGPATNNGITGNDTDDTLTLRTANADRITIKGSQVAIGTSDPKSYKLYVKGSLNVEGQIHQYESVFTSDRKFKNNIKPVTYALSKVTRMEGVSYNWKTDEYKDRGFSEGRHYGVIAQEIEKVLPEIVREDHNGDKAVAYTELIPILIEAVKEQQKMIEDQKVKIAALEFEQQAMKEQQAMVSALFEKVNALEKQVQLQSTVALADD